VHLTAHGVAHPAQHRVGRAAHHFLVEVGVVGRHRRLVVAGQRVRGQVQGLSHPGQVLVGTTERGTPGGEGLQGDLHVQDVVDVLGIQTRDLRAPPGEVRDEALGDELLEGRCTTTTPSRPLPR
jgi:hypothetical protein